MHGLWDFRPGKERKPTAAEIKALSPLIDFRQVELNAEKRSVYLKRPGMKIGLGGIAKGYAIDLAAARLLKMGIKNSIIRAGGCMSVTILAPDTMTSDALSTAIFVLGSVKGLRLINRLNGIEAIVAGASGTILTSEGIYLSK